MNEDSVPETGFVNLQQILLEAISWHQKGDLERASSVYARVLELEPEHFDALHLLGVIAIQCGEPERAVELIGKAIRINPNSTAAYYNRAKALRDLRQFNASLNDYDNAIARDHNQADIHYNRGNVLREMRQYEAAVGSYEKAVALAPLYVEALNNLGDTLRELGRYTQALQCYDRVLALQPKYHFLHGMRLHTQMHVGEWHDLADGISQLEAEIECGEMTSPPFQILPIIGSADLQRKAAEIWADRKYPVTSGPLPVPEFQRHEKIRLGYFSADFHNHATTEASG
jgi:tetratricopeptide (TPR) repeat protein